MNTEKLIAPGPFRFTWFTLVLFFALPPLSMMFVWAVHPPKSIGNSASQTIVTNGYGAPESAIENGATYLCQIMLKQPREDGKGIYFSILQELQKTPKGFKVSGEKRLFKLSQSVGKNMSGTYDLFRAEKDGAKVSFAPVGRIEDLLPDD